MSPIEGTHADLDAGSGAEPHPLFVGGCPRSGTTLLGAMLGAGSRVVCTPESQFKNDLARMLRADPLQITGAQALPVVLGHERFEPWGLELSPEAVPTELLQRSYADLLRWLATRYADTRGKPSPRHWVDHTPGNIRTTTTLLRLFSDARVVHMVRDGRDVASSVLPLDWGPNSIDRAARWWGAQVGQGLAAERGHGGSVLRVRFEDLVNAPASQLQRVCAFAGIEFEPRMARGGGFEIPAYTWEQHRRVQGPPDPGRVGVWRERLAPRAVEIFEAEAGELLELLGYSPAFGPRARGPSPREKLFLGVSEVLARSRNRILRKRRRRRARRVPAVQDR